MTMIDSLRALASGSRPHDLLLPPARLMAGGAEYFGEEAIVHAFRRDPLNLSDKADVIATEGYIAIFDGETALFATLYGERIAKLWRLGPGDVGPVEPAIGVPFDTDLRQARCDVAFRAADHPALSARGAQLVEAIGRDLAHGSDAERSPPTAYRTRPFAIAAFDNGTRGAALFAAFTLGPDAVRTSGFTFVAAGFEITAGKDGKIQIVRDVAGEKARDQRKWRTRFA